MDDKMREYAAYELYKVHSLAMGLLPCKDWHDVSERQREVWLSVSK